MSRRDAYRTLVNVPMRSALPPESVQACIAGTDYSRVIFRFVGPPYMVVRTVPVVEASVAAWHLPWHRRALLVAVACLAFVVAFILAYIYPIYAVHFEQAGRGASAEDDRIMAG